jgi:predicted transglutaminase-like cysteine proteinase
VARGIGDCEDYALLKLAMLVALGVPETDMSVVVVKDTSRGIGHAILAVRTRDGYEVLDNLSDAVRRDSEVTSYVPLYSIGAAGAWVHGRRREVPMVQAATQRSAPVTGAQLRGSLN